MNATISFLLVSITIAFAQQPPAKPTFEVATIRPADPNLADSVFVGMSADPSFVTYRNTNLRDAIRGAYKVRDFQIVGPDWMSTARFDIAAKLPPGASTDQIPEMFQPCSRRDSSSPGIASPRKCRSTLCCPAMTARS